MLRSYSLIAVLTIACLAPLAMVDAQEADRVEEDSEALYTEALESLSKAAFLSGDRAHAISLLRKSAELGYMEAYNLLGFLYIEGNGLLRSPRKGNGMFAQAAALNNATAQYNLGYSYRFGRGVKGDLTEAERLFRLVIEPEEPHAISPEGYGVYRSVKGAAYYYLGDLYAGAEMGESNKERSIAYMKAADELGNSNAAMFLAIKYALGEGVEKNADDAERYLERYNLLSQNEFRLSISKTFFEGMDRDLDVFFEEMARSVADELDEEVTRMKVSFGVSLMSDPNADIYDPAMAARWLELAEEDSIPARVRLARLYYRGEGVERDSLRARELLESASDRNSMAAYNLGVLIASGEGAERWGEAETLFREAAEKDLFVAQRYLDDEGALEYLSFEEAKEQCIAAAQAGDFRAQYSYGIRLMYGWGVGADGNEARMWIEGAAREGYAPAQFVLATRFAGFFDGMFTKKWIGSSAEQGYLPARHQMAVWMLSGTYFKRDIEGAISLLRECVKDSYPESLTRLGMLYRTGLGVERDLDKSRRLLEAAVEAGDSIGLMRLAEVYRDGLGVDQDMERGLEMMIESADWGSINAHYLVGEMYSSGAFGEPNWEEAVDWYEEAGGHGHASSWMVLGDCYRDGVGAAESKLQALQWYSRAASSWGNLEAQYEVAVLLAQPNWSQSNPKQALEIFRDLELQAYAPATFQLGVMNAEGIGLKRNEKKAIEKWRRVSRYGLYRLETRLGGRLDKLYKKKASRLQFSYPSNRSQKMMRELAVEALFRLGGFVLEGKGVSKDPPLGAALIELAAESEHAEAAFRMALLYDEGKGVAASERKSLDWLEKAAEKEHVDALFALGTRLLSSEPTGDSREEGIEFLRRAGQKGHVEALKLLRELTGEEPSGEEGGLRNRDSDFRDLRVS